MTYIEILLKLNKLKKVLFFILLIFMACGYLLQKNIEKNIIFMLIYIFHQAVF